MPITSSVRRKMKRVERKLKRIDKLLDNVERRLLKATLILLSVRRKQDEQQGD